MSHINEIPNANSKFFLLLIFFIYFFGLLRLDMANQKWKPSHANDVFMWLWAFALDLLEPREAQRQQYAYHQYATNIFFTTI